jgi:hypothetical protein
VALNSTTSNYAKQINIAYPKAGQDNDSQGFRTNFTNIQNSLLAADQDIQNLYSNLVLTNSTSTNFHYNRIVQAVFQNCADQIYSAPETSGNITVDVSQGGYQDYQLSNDVVFTPAFWPSSGYGSVIVACTPTVQSVAVSFFGTVTPIGIGTTFPDEITVKTFYQVWSADEGTTVYVTKIGNNSQVLTSATATDITAYNSLTIDNHQFTTGTNYQNVVSSNGMYGTLALIPNQVTTTLNGSTVTVPGTLSIFSVASGTGIKVGATTQVATSSTQFTVTAVTGTNITVTPSLPSQYVSVPASITFTNPFFSNQPSLVYQAASAPALTGAVGDTPGRIFASSSTLHASFANYDGVNQNWIRISADNVVRQLPAGTSATTVSIVNSSTVIATTEFTQNLVSAAIYGGIEGALPPGIITMWYGNIATIPAGWALCNGQTVNGFATPDLRNRFVIAAASDSAGVAVTTVSVSTSTVGGSTDIPLISHFHQAISNVIDPGHIHESQYDGRTPGSIDYNGSGSEIGGMGTGYNYPTTSTGTNISVTTSILATGTSNGSMANLPPYYALAYIMKVV